MSPVPPHPRIWFFDTCTLLNLQVSADLDALVQKRMQGEDCVLLEEVVTELDRLVDEGPADVADLARTALNNIGWLGRPEPADDYAELNDIVHWQDQVADGRALKHPKEHWAEACIIAAIEVLPETCGAAVFLSDEYSARLHADAHEWCTPFSVHRYLYELVQSGDIGGELALSMATELHAADRGIECCLEDFTAKTPKGLGRPGQP